MWARANNDGEIVLTDLPIGDSLITVTHAGFKNLPLVVTIRNADELEVAAKLEAGVEMLPGNFRNIPPKKRKHWWIFR